MWLVLFGLRLQTCQTIAVTASSDASCLRRDTTILQNIWNYTPNSTAPYLTRIWYSKKSPLPSQSNANSPTTQLAALSLCRPTCTSFHDVRLSVATWAVRVIVSVFTYFSASCKFEPLCSNPWSLRKTATYSDTDSLFLPSTFNLEQNTVLETCHSIQHAEFLQTKPRNAYCSSALLFNVRERLVAAAGKKWRTATLRT
jgi:hypothetical protein